MSPVDDPTLSPIKRENGVKEEEAKLAANGDAKKTKEAPKNKSGTKAAKGQMNIKDMFAKASAKRKVEAKDDSDDEDESPKKVKLAIERCRICSQLIDRSHIKMHLGAQTGARDELTVLFDTSNHFMISSEDFEDKPCVNLHDFSVYDEEGHLVPLDTGLLEKGAVLYFDGLLTNLFDEGKRVPVKKCKLDQWWTSGFDGGEGVIIGYSSEYADYHLKEPSDIYRSFMKDIWEQAFLVKYMIEFLESNDAEDEGDEEEEEGVYLRFIEYLAQIKPPRDDMDDLTSETVVKHAEVLVGQMISYQEAGIKQDKNILDSPLLKSICELAGIQQNQVRKAKQGLSRAPQKKKPSEPKFVEATVTPLVRLVFEDLFSGQMADDGGKGRSKACGSCEQCLSPDCGTCRSCKDMLKFGGKGKSKQKCKERKCNNMTSIPQEDDLSAEEEENKKSEKKTTSSQIRVKKLKKSDTEFEWVGEGTKLGGKTYYTAVLYNDETISKGDTVLLAPEMEDVPSYVGRVQYLYQSKGEPMFHLQWFFRGTDTVLGETWDKAELFLSDNCDEESLFSFLGKAAVEMNKVPDQEEWRILGGSVPRRVEPALENEFFCSLWYDPDMGRFEYPKGGEEPEGGDLNACRNCTVRKEKEERFIPRVHEKVGGAIKSVMWDRSCLKIGDCIYLTPGSAKMKTKPSKGGKETLKKNMDEDKYPEYYRKKEYVKGNNLTTPDPFIVARVIKFKEGEEMKVQVGLFYRPEDTSLNTEEDHMNLLFWSQDTDWVPASELRGRCYVRCLEEEKAEKMSEWCDQGPDRWFFRKSYDSVAKTDETLPKEAEGFGSTLQEENIPAFPQIKKKLASLDIFAGCGGLSQGLHDAGVAETLWAVEVFEPAANAFKANNKDCTVFTDDCNLLLRNVIEGKEFNDKKQKYPKRGEVELLCGGPPCQGFSGMNRFNSGEYSLFKNSLVASYLSYAEYYRPKYFILENVKNFANFKKSMVMKSCLRALVKMGYQCTFGIVQAGHFGVAQTRRRAIILAAAPGEVLPRYPEPEHVFSPQACHLSVEVDGHRFDSQTRWSKSAPRRTVTVRDTMSDLPKIQNGESAEVMNYGGEPLSHFQRRIRAGSDRLYDHVTKKMAPLIVKRFEFIPTTSGSDWRDLPNEVVELSDETYTKKLLYFHHDAKNGKSSTGEKRGVCSCASGGKCDAMYKQQNTLIPWCLPHTGNRHNHWAGLYGRVEWEGFFSTTITNPEPMGKQGRVLHPNQNRLVSVRECARSQGFPDTYKFYGSVLEKHRQIGNAVPPPMGRAIGLCIGEAMGPKSTK